MNFKIGDRVVFKLKTWQKIFDSLDKRIIKDFDRNNPVTIIIVDIHNGIICGRTDDYRYFKFHNEDDVLKAPS